MALSYSAEKKSQFFERLKNVFISFEKFTHFFYFQKVIGNSGL